jgi:ABC-type dipeptide/oligopeptide/nickel transport system permease subunit
MTWPFVLAVLACACLDQSAFLAVIIVACLYWLGGASVAIARISHLVTRVPFARIDCLVF